MASFFGQVWRKINKTCSKIECDCRTGLIRRLLGMRTGKISLEEGKNFLSNYRNGLYGYTYLE